MGEKDQGRLEFLQSLIADLKKIEGDQQTTIVHLAKVQGDLQNEGKETVALKIGEIFSNADKNTQILHEIIAEYQMEVNKLKAGG